MEECAAVQIIHEVEEGEISDSPSSVEEISEEAFKSPTSQPPPPTSFADAMAVNPPVAQLHSNSAHDFNVDTNLNNKQPRGWTVRDLYSYGMSRNYSAGLHNLAWASAVQNKTLDDVLVMEYPNNSGNSSLKCESAASEVPVTAPAAENLEDNGVVTEVSGEEKDDEEKEGELEEGEIDFDSDIMIEVDRYVSKAEENEKEDENNSVLGQDQTFNLIRKRLQSVTTQEAEKSLDEVSSRIEKVLDSVEDMTEKDLLTAKDVIAPLAFDAIKTVNTVFYSMNHILEESNKETMLRLLAHVSNLKCPLFSVEQLKEIEDMVFTLDSSFMSLGSKDAYLDKDMKEKEELAYNDTDLSSRAPKDIVQSVMVPVEASDQSELKKSQENSKSANSKRGFSLPLLDLHRNHDADSLPSPTRGGGPSSFSSDKGFAVVNGLLKPEWPVPRVVLDRETVPLHPYETDAVKAVSFYQQKFGRSSFFMNDRLPSPTPSEEGDTGEGDVGGEVSSSCNEHVNQVNTSLVGLSAVSSAPKMNIPGGRGLTSTLNGSLSNYVPSLSLKPSSVKNRDPRLRLISQEHKVDPAGGIFNSKKQKTVEDMVSSGPALKRHKVEQTEMNIVRSVTGTGSWLEDSGLGGLGVTNRSHEPLRSVNDPSRRPEFTGTGVSSASSIPTITSNPNVTLSGTSASLQSLLQDIAVNPSMWMNILKMEQHKLVTPTQTTTHPIMSNSNAGPVPSTSVVASRPPGPGERVAGINPTTPQIPSVEELGKVRMKPRDPRRILHSSAVQKGGNIMEWNPSLNKTSTSSAPGTMGSTNFPKQDDALDNKNMASHSFAPPDITWQFTKNLKNIADMVSVSQTTSSESVVPRSIMSAPEVESGDFHNVPGRDDQVTSDSAALQNDWNDVEHLFDSFDDQQKAAIHSERGRRLEEQQKMFAGRKLCLVLDLDHTLLNSAKFAEVTAMHDEMLRKKEELDREKSHRHLFRFPHMSMWTKLRPGIWNFLERASKLYELHLYTMGNKLYATEMAKLLDPKGELFAGRVISRGDDGDLLDGDERAPKIKDLEGVMGMESSVVIIDDSVRVWPHNKLNLIVVERYIYFPCSRRQFGLPGPSLLEIDHDERAEDGTLASSLAVIERIHQIFFEHQSLDEADVRNILSSEQRKILGGCCILFSRVFPVGEVNPHLHPLWQTAEQFGAVCTTTIDEKVTHVVANSPGTDKVNWALSTGRFVVHPGWVEASALLYRRANEQDFAIKP